MSDHDHDRRLTDEQARYFILARDRQRWLGRWQEDELERDGLRGWRLLGLALLCWAAVGLLAVAWWVFA